MITAAAFVAALTAAALAVFALYQVRAGWKKIRERETLADAFEKVLRGREAKLREREKALWWAERSPRWVQR